jgi:hypothetical protein
VRALQLPREESGDQLKATRPRPHLSYVQKLRWGARSNIRKGLQGRLQRRSWVYRGGAMQDRASERRRIPLERLYEKSSNASQPPRHEPSHGIYERTSPLADNLSLSLSSSSCSSRSMTMSAPPTPRQNLQSPRVAVVSANYCHTFFGPLSGPRHREPLVRLAHSSVLIPSRSPCDLGTVDGRALSTKPSVSTSR